MSALVVALMPKREFNVAGMSAGTNQRMAIVERVDVSQYTDCIMVVRIHALNLTAGNSLSFDFWGDGFTDDDPALAFRTATPLLSYLVDAQVTTPFLGTLGAIVRGHLATLMFTATRGASTATATVSIDLVLRGADESVNPSPEP